MSTFIILSLPTHPLSPPLPPSFQALSHLHLPPTSAFSSEMLLLPCLFFIRAFCLWEWVGSAPVERSEHCHTKSVWGPSSFFFLFFRTICLWWTWMSSLVCKLLSFGWMPVPLTWMHFYIAYIVISSSHLVWSCVSGVLCWTGRLFLPTVTPEIVKERLSTELLYWEDRRG